MKIETIKERIAKAEEKIIKKEATLARHQKGADKLLKVIQEHRWNPEDRYCRQGTEEHNDAYWTICDYDHKLEDIERTNEAIEEAKESLQKYQNMLQEETEKANSRNIKIIMEFLERWKAMNIEFFLEQKVKYEKALAKHNEKIKEMYSQMEALGYGASWNKKDANYEKYQELYKERDEMQKRFRYAWLHVTQFDHGSKDWETTMREDLELEKNRKYDDLIARTNKIVGQITDANRLKINEKENLDGFITGTKGTAKVETIGAGGYNIQCFHFRTLIHEVK